MPHPGDHFVCPPACVRLLAALLLLLNLVAAASPFVSATDPESSSGIERVLGLADSDCDAGDKPVCWVTPRLPDITPTALPKQGDLHQPRIGGFFAPEPPPPRFA